MSKAQFKTRRWTQVYFRNGCIKSDGCTGISTRNALKIALQTSEGHRFVHERYTTRQRRWIA